jgi:hypothetical protein
MMSSLERMSSALGVAPSLGLSPAGLAALLGVLVLCIAVQAWCLWRVMASLTALLPLEERVSRLTRSVALLVDTTEGCFEAVSAQIVRTGDTPTASRQQRQRRVVGAAKRGRSIAQIAAEEALAEGEVALRVRMARDLQSN